MFHVQLKARKLHKKHEKIELTVAKLMINAFMHLKNGSWRVYFFIFTRNFAKMTIW